MPARRLPDLAIAFTTTLLLLSACSPLPDTVGEAAPTGALYRLVTFNDAPADFSATIRFQPDGRISGAGPCNGFTAQQKAPLPWLEITNIASARRTCPDQLAEDAFFLALGNMRFAEVAADSVLLTNNSGQSLFFRSGLRDPSEPRDGP